MLKDYRIGQQFRLFGGIYEVVPDPNQKNPTCRLCAFDGIQCSKFRKTYCIPSVRKDKQFIYYRIVKEQY